MSLFRKKSSSDIIDFTALQKRGILQRAEKEDSGDDEFLRISPPSMPSSPNSPQDSLSPGLDMFSAMDKLAGTSQAPMPSNSSYPSNIQDSDFNSLKLKVDDLEFKLEKLIEKLEALEGSISS